MVDRTDVVLLVFGGTSVAGIWIVGVLIDRYLRRLTLASTILFGAAALTLGMAGGDPVAVYAAVGAWGLAFGGAATLFQTALARSAGDAADIAQSMLVTAWNAAIASGGIVGGVLLDRFGRRGILSCAAGTAAGHAAGGVVGQRSRLSRVGGMTGRALSRALQHACPRMVRVQALETLPQP
ncbi:putative arabinose transporter [Raoultella terrigena]|uniref:Putative arabinose transporter n=1 Tax=Raoultella terrigena TaxID=577 RepID=A0A4U9DEY8_RAOTE|nr:putative arabinose transporter [Raoultella terrigena]